MLLTCIGVRVAHGSNDGQKGVGIAMLIVIGLLHAHYVLNLEHDRQEIAATRRAAAELAAFVEEQVDEPKDGQAAAHAQTIEALLKGADTNRRLSVQKRWRLRMAILGLDAAVRKSIKRRGDQLSSERRDELSH